MESASVESEMSETRRLKLTQRSKKIVKVFLLGIERSARFILTRVIFGVLLAAGSFSSITSLLSTVRKALRSLCLRALMHRWMIALFLLGAYTGGLIVEEAERPCSHSNDGRLLAGVLDLKRRFLADTSEDELLQPRIVAMPDIDPAGETQPKVKYTRPEFLRSELGVREKVLVIVLASRESAARLALPLSRMMVSRSMPVLVFAKSADFDAMPPELDAIKIDLSTHSVWEFPLRVMAHVQSNYGSKYDFYYFIPDTIYVRGEVFNDFISRVPISVDLYTGIPAGQQEFCDFDAGIIFSKAILDRISANLANCTQLATASYTKTIGLCVAQSTKMKCSSNAEMLAYSAFVLQIPASSLNERVLRETSGLNESHVVYPVATSEAFYRLHEYFCTTEIETLKKEIKEAEVEAWRTKLLPLSDPAAEIPWPVGTRQQTRPEKRFDIKRWDYFDMTGIYYDNEFMNVRPLTGADKLDITEVIEKAQSVIFTKYPEKYSFERLANGYRKLDPNRGMMYIVDLEFRESTGYKKVLKRVELLRPVSSIELINMPAGVSSKTALLVVLPVYADTSYEHWKTFLRKYESEIANAKYEAELAVAFFYGEREQQQLAKKVDVYRPLKDELKALKQRGSVPAFDVKAGDPSQTEMMAVLYKHLPATSVIAVVSAEVDLSSELLDRVKANTVKAKQVYSPVGFWQYLPELVYNATNRTPDVEVNRDYGHFETNSYEHISFHMSDYVDALSAVDSTKLSDIYDIFLAARRLHIMRAVEPALRLRHREVNCLDGAVASCTKIRHSSLASKARLALVYFKDMGLI